MTPERGERKMSRRAVLLATGAVAHEGGRRKAQAGTPNMPKAATGGFPGLSYEKEGRWAGPFVFLQLADTQFGMFDADASWEKETALFEHAVEHINRLRPKFAIVCGDLVNRVPPGPKHRAQVAEFQRIARRVDP